MNACFACSRLFPANDELEWLPQGRMFAFDTGRGRLWVICGWCSQWSLMPIEQRWEAVEELERLTSSGRVLGATGEVSLIQIGRVRAVRVGRAQLQEEAWWRFGTSLRGRQRRYAIVSSIGGALSAGAAVTGLLAMAAVPGMIEIAALRRFRVTKVPDVPEEGEANTLEPSTAASVTAALLGTVPPPVLIAGQFCGG